jgi:response regulator of citrate/malate metabolism
MERERDEGGKYTEQVTLEDVRAVFERVDLPVVTASEVAEELECARPTAYTKLEQLVEQGEVRKKKVVTRTLGNSAREILRISSRFGRLSRLHPSSPLV